MAERSVLLYEREFANVKILFYLAYQSTFTYGADKIAIALSVLLLSYILETLQYFGIVEILGLKHSTIAGVIIGTSLEWIDMLAYTLGILTVLIAEREKQI